MGLAGNFDKKVNKGNIFLITGVILLLVSVALLGKDIYYLTHFEHVETTLNVIHYPDRGYKAYASYEYQGQRYEEKALSFYNAFVMKDDKTFTVLIDPAKPDSPKSTTFSIDACLMFFGIISVLVGLKRLPDAR